MKFRLALISCLLVWALPSFAIPCLTPFNPLVDSDALAVCAPNGGLYDYVSVTEANENANTIYTLTLAGPDLNQFGFATTFCEFAAPCGPALPQIYYSDIFGVASTNGGYYLGFSSDNEAGTPYGSEGYYFIPEPNGWYPATVYLDPALQAQGYTAWFISSVPEPTTMLLIGSGIALLAKKLRK